MPAQGSGVVGCAACNMQQGYALLTLHVLAAWLHHGILLQGQSSCGRCTLQYSASVLAEADLLCPSIVQPKYMHRLVGAVEDPAGPQIFR